MGEVATVFDGGDVIAMADIQEFVTSVQKAWAVHVDRERIRHGLWKDYPAADQCNQIKVKIDRVLRSLEYMKTMETGFAREAAENEQLCKNILEELPDIINYAIFADRILEERI